MKTKLIGLLLTLALLPAASFAQTWQKKQARIMTKWSENITPENVLPEYPRPQMVRDDNSWMNLNGLWDFTRVTSRVYKKEQTYTDKILVPFPMESALSGLMWTDHVNQSKKNYLYRRTFNVPAAMREGNKRILLHFGGVGWLSEVYVNGTRVGQHTGEYDPFYFDITDKLTASGDQELCVFVIDPQGDGGVPAGKQTVEPGGIFYTPSTGIWQTVWLEAVSQVYIRNLRLTPDIDKKEINVRVVTSAISSRYKAEVEIYDGKNRISQTKDISVGRDKAIKLSNMKLWSPDSPFLYDMKVKLYEDDKLIDTVDSYFGMRKISIGTFDGAPCMMLNNNYIFQYGVLDQGWWPDGLYTAPSDEALLFDVQLVKQHGMNLNRKHLKIEPDRWYYHCDREGVLVWQDMAAAHGPNTVFEIGTTKQDNFLKETKDIMASLHNHPCIVMWVPYNEGGGQPNGTDCKRTVDTMRSLDHTRLINLASGWNDYEYGDIKDTHWYAGAPNAFPNPINKRVTVVGEFGGAGLFLPNNSWNATEDQVYFGVKDNVELTEILTSYADNILGLGSQGNCAAVYTQLSDIEDEVNGLVSYDRKVIKLSNSQIKSLADRIKRNYTHCSLSVMETSQKKGERAIWKYTQLDKPFEGDNLKNWMKPDYDDSSWKSGEAPFGNEVELQYDDKDKPMLDNWKTNYIYLRRTIEFNDRLTADNLNKLRLKIHHDEDVTVYLNGIEVASYKGYTQTYEYKPFTISTAQLRKAIKLGEPNEIAVVCKQTSGGQCIDLGFCIYDVERKLFLDTTATDSPAAAEGDALLISPNPADSEFTLSTDGSEPIASVQLFDLTGKLVQRFPAQTSYSVAGLSQGIYLVLARVADRQLSSRLIVQ